MTLQSWILFIYLAIIAVVTYIRFWTEGGFWAAIHTGRTFMLQAATLAVGTGFTYLDQAGRLAAIIPFIPHSNVQAVKDILKPTLSNMLTIPEIIFGFAISFIVLYILTAFPEREFLKRSETTGQPKKYISAINQEPTLAYKFLIGIYLGIGIGCLLCAWFFILGIGFNDYLLQFILPVYIILVAIFILGWFIGKIRGTEGKPQQWDLRRFPGRLE